MMQNNTFLREKKEILGEERHWHKHILYLSTLVVWRHFQGSVLGLGQIFGGAEQVLQPEADILPHCLVVTLLLPPFLVFLQDDTVDQAQALPQSPVQQLHLLLRAGLLCVMGQGDDASLVWGVVYQEGLSLFLKVARKKMGSSW